MKKVLIISYFFPPQLAAGAQRPHKLAKYLPEYGWKPIVLTPKIPGVFPDGIHMIATDYKDVVTSLRSAMGMNSQKSMHEQIGIRVTKNYSYPTVRGKIIKIAKDIITYPDERKGWFSFAYKSACEFLDKNRIDAIISTSPSIVTHLIARKLKRKYKIPWIADFRDPWTQKYIDSKMEIIKFFERRLEKRTISSADILVSVSNPYVDKIGSFHEGKKIYCITNGFDPAEFPGPGPELTKKFTITYAGTLYNGRRDPSLVFEAVSQLLKEGRIRRDLVEIRFYTQKEKWLDEDIRKNNLSDIVDVHGFLPRDEIINKLRETQILLLIRWDNAAEDGSCPAKIYEYFAVRRPIIYTGGCGGIIKDMLDSTNTGRFAENVESVKTILMEYYREFLDRGSISYQGNGNIEKYNYNLIAMRYSEVLNELIP